jgi:hypothetical protein
VNTTWSHEKWSHVSVEPSSFQTRTMLVLMPSTYQLPCHARAKERLRIFLNARKSSANLVRTFLRTQKTSEHTVLDCLRHLSRPETLPRRAGTNRAKTHFDRGQDRSRSRTRSDPIMGKIEVDRGLDPIRSCPRSRWIKDRNRVTHALDRFRSWVGTDPILRSIQVDHGQE